MQPYIIHESGEDSTLCAMKAKDTEKRLSRGELSIAEMLRIEESYDDPME